jgi:hypothetical protein
VLHTTHFFIGYDSWRPKSNSACFGILLPPKIETLQTQNLLLNSKLSQTQAKLNDVSHKAKIWLPGEQNLKNPFLWEYHDFVKMKSATSETDPLIGYESEIMDEIFDNAPTDFLSRTEDISGKVHAEYTMCTFGPSHPVEPSNAHVAKQPMTLKER